MKKCAVCKKELPLEQFGKHSGNPDGKNHICLACDRELHRQRRVLKIKRLLFQRYGGRCAGCDAGEGLEVVPIIERKRMHLNCYILACEKCKMDAGLINIFLRDCAKCGYRWVARRKRTITCPNCGSPYWFRPKGV